MKAKVFSAACAASIVLVGGIPVACTILGEGIGPSTGFLIIEGDDAFYVPKTSPDLKATIESIGTILDKIVAIATALNAVTVPPGSATSLIAQLVALNVTLAASKEVLK